MRCRNDFSFLIRVAVAWAICCPLELLAQDAAPPAKAAPSENAAASAEAESPAEEVDRYAVPAGDVEQLLKFISELQSFRPTSREEFMDHGAKSPAALESAAKKIQELETDKESEAWRKASGVLLGLSIGKMVRATAEERKETLARLIEHLSNKELGREDIGLAMNAAQILDYVGEQDEAAEVNESLAKIFAAASNPAFGRYGEMFAGSARRLRLPGNAMKLQGAKLDGTKFDLTELKGKVVLVDFWATWCGPCRAEFPNMLKNYEAYHDKGFEVVGISLDQDRAALEKYIEEKQVPWITLHEKEANGRHPAATEYGIMGIPSMFLIGRDGNVLSTEARGEELNRLLAEQFGSDEAANADGS